MTFPVNILDELNKSLSTYMDKHRIIERPLRYTDPVRSIGLFIADWTPQEDSKEMPQREPVLSRYQFRIQNLVKHSDEVLGKRMFATDAKSIRVVLYRDPALAVALPALSEVVLGTQERVTRWGIGRQRFLSNELQGQWVFLAQTDLWVETESVFV